MKSIDVKDLSNQVKDAIDKAKNQKTLHLNYNGKIIKIKLQGE